MANWDHKSNIGTHPVLDPDPAIRLLAKIEAAAVQVERHRHALEALKSAATDAGVDMFAIRAASSRGRQYAREQVAA